METWECVEVCPHCDNENILQWNTEIQGFVAKCQHCGKKLDTAYGVSSLL